MSFLRFLCLLLRRYLLVWPWRYMFDFVIPPLILLEKYLDDMICFNKNDVLAKAFWLKACSPTHLDMVISKILKLRNIFEVFLMSTRENLQIYKIKKSIKSDESSLNVFYFFVKIPRQIYQCLYFCVPPLMVGTSHILLNFLSLYFSLSKGTWFL